MKIRKKIKAKAKSFCQTIEKIKDRNENQMPGESRLVPLRDSCNGCALVCLDGFRYIIHRDHKLAIMGSSGKCIKTKNFCQFTSKTANSLHFL